MKENLNGMPRDKNLMSENNTWHGFNSTLYSAEVRNEFENRNRN